MTVTTPTQWIYPKRDSQDRLIEQGTNIMIEVCVFNSGWRTGKRWIQVDPARTQVKMDYMGKPYMIFEHSEFPLGPLEAKFQDNNWYCDLD
jgi:hypothetical protein